MGRGYWGGGACCLGSVDSGEKVVRGKSLEGGWAKLADGVGIFPRRREGEGEGGVVLRGWRC